MKKVAISSLLVPVFLFFGLFFLKFSVSGQETSTLSPALPDNVNQIISASCVPCHTSKGGIIARSKLNFSEWIRYSPEKQKEKAGIIYSELKKGAMPPKSARENRPEIVPSKEQVNTIKKWAESLKADGK